MNPQMADRRCTAIAMSTAVVVKAHPIKTALETDSLSQMKAIAVAPTGSATVAMATRDGWV